MALGLAMRQHVSLNDVVTGPAPHDTNYSRRLQALPVYETLDTLRRVALHCMCI
jgi:hypothetical protein